jgi:aminoglycoside/choline kinase family phosphotransferase
MQLLVDWMLPALAVQPSAEEAKMIEESFDFLAKSALAQPQVIVHRDFHSRNLMKIADELELGVIDFQDAVIGADTYDLISLTRDAYVQWPISRVHAWFQAFYDLLPDASKQQRSFEQFQRDADLMAIQRHLKILGIFVRLFERDGKSGYLKDLPRVMWYLRTEAQPYAELQALLNFVEQRLMPAFTEKYGQFEAVTA